MTTAAAAAVVLLPTACDSALATPDAGYSSGGHSGHSSSYGQGGAGTSSAVAVPVGETQEAEPTDEAELTDEDQPESPDGQNADGENGDDQGGGDQEGDQGGDDQGGDQDGDDQGGDADQNGDGGAGETEAPDVTETPDDTAPPEDTDAPPPPPPPAGGLEILGDDCSNSDLQLHDGFQLSPRCVATAGGEVASVERSPSLLITDAPQTVASGEEFTLTVSTRNLVRDRFLGAAAGGYYRESSFLNEDGVQRGHFHTACRMLDSTSVAPDSSGDPEFFLATQDNGGGIEPDQVAVTVTGLTGPGTAQCAVWAGDGSHRVPMMTRANQTPAFDVVRITVE